MVAGWLATLATSLVVVALETRDRVKKVYCVKLGKLVVASRKTDGSDLARCTCVPYPALPRLSLCPCVGAAGMRTWMCLIAARGGRGLVEKFPSPTKFKINPPDSETLSTISSTFFSA